MSKKGEVSDYDTPIADLLRTNRSRKPEHNIKKPGRKSSLLVFRSDLAMESVTGQGSGPCHKTCVIGLERRVGKVRIAVLKKMYHQETAMAHICMTVQ